MNPQFPHLCDAQWAPQALRPNLTGRPHARKTPGQRCIEAHPGIRSGGGDERHPPMRSLLGRGGSVISSIRGSTRTSLGPSASGPLARRGVRTKIGPRPHRADQRGDRRAGAAQSWATPATSPCLDAPSFPSVDHSSILSDLSRPAHLVFPTWSKPLPTMTFRDLLDRRIPSYRIHLGLRRPAEASVSGTIDRLVRGPLRSQTLLKCA